MNEELKKEIESAAVDYANGPDVDEWDNDVCYAAFIAGAEWALKQQIGHENNDAYQGGYKRGYTTGFEEGANSI